MLCRFLKSLNSTLNSILFSIFFDDDGGEECCLSDSMFSVWKHLHSFGFSSHLVDQVFILFVVCMHIYLFIFQGVRFNIVWNFRYSDIFKKSKVHLQIFTSVSLLSCRSN